MKMTRPDDDDVVTDLDEILLTDLSVGRGAARESPRLAREERAGQHQHQQGEQHQQGTGQHQHQQGSGEHLHQHLKKTGVGGPSTINMVSMGGGAASTSPGSAASAGGGG